MALSRTIRIIYLITSVLFTLVPIALIVVVALDREERMVEEAIFSIALFLIYNIICFFTIIATPYRPFIVGRYRSWHFRRSWYKWTIWVLQLMLTLILMLAFYILVLDSVDEDSFLFNSNKLIFALFVVQFIGGFGTFLFWMKQTGSDPYQIEGANIAEVSGSTQNQKRTSLSDMTKFKVFRDMYVTMVMFSILGFATLVIYNWTDRGLNSNDYLITSTIILLLTAQLTPLIFTPFRGLLLPNGNEKLLERRWYKWILWIAVMLFTAGSSILLTLTLRDFTFYQLDFRESLAITITATTLMTLVGEIFTFVFWLKRTGRDVQPILETSNEVLDDDL